MSRYMDPTIATVITNPTNRDLKYGFLGSNGMFVKAGCTIIFPYDVFTSATTSQKAQLSKALETKMVRMSYRTSIEVEQVDLIANGIMHEGPKASKVQKAVKETPVQEKEETKAAEKTPREKIIVETGEGKDALKESEDLVQKFTGQETVSMRDAMGWEPPATDDPRTPQEIEVVKMSDAASENVGSPEEKAAAAAAKEAATVDAKKSEAAKKAAATRKANAAKKAAEAKKK